MFKKTPNIKNIFDMLSNQAWSGISGIITILALVISIIALKPIFSSSTNLHISPARRGETLIIISDFEKRGDAPEADFRERIYQALNQKFIENNIENIRLEKVSSLGQDTAKIREIGAKYRAFVVIWGWYDAAGYFPNFEILQNTDKLLPIKPGDVNSPISEDDYLSFQTFVSDTLPNSMVYFTNSTIGQIYYYKEDYKSAVTFFDIAVENISAILPYIKEACPCGFEQIFCMRGQSLYKLGDYERTLENYQEVAKLNPDIDWPHSWINMLYRQKGEDELAIQEAENIINNNSSPYLISWAHHDLAITYRGQGNETLMQSHFADAIRTLPPDTYSYHYQRGLLEKDAELLNDAKIDLQKALSEESENNVPKWMILMELGNVEADLGALNDAERHFTEALQSLPKTGKNDDKYTIMYSRGNMYLGLQDYQKAFKDFDSLVKNAPNPQNYYERGLARQGLKKYEAAIDDFQKAVELDPEGQVDASDYYQIGISRKELGQISEAINAFETCIQLDQDNAWKDLANHELQNLRSETP